MNIKSRLVRSLRDRRTIVICVAILVALGSWLAFTKGKLLPVGASVTSSKLSVPSGGKTGFTMIQSSETGITFENPLRDELSTRNQILLNGSGVATGDFDNDGLCDVYFCRLDGSNVLYRNLGDWRFEDVTDKAGVGATGKQCTGATFADIDGDGDLDLLVAAFGSFNCYLNDGKGHFTEVANTAGLASKLGANTIALADIDGDGDLDLYVSHYRLTTLKDGGDLRLQAKDGRFVIPPELRDRITFANGSLREYGEPDTLYRNDGKGHFSEVSWTGGSFLDEDGNVLKGPPLDWGLNVTFRDINNDGYPDIYVCNDFWTPDRIWINDGKGRFRALDKLALRCTSASSMGVDFADIDGDGNQDFMVVDMLSRDHKHRMTQSDALKPLPSNIGAIDNRPQINRNTLFLNRGDNTFAEIANLANVSASEWSWTTIFFDIDLDGRPDLFIANGHGRDLQNLDTAAKLRLVNEGSDEEMRRNLLMYPRLHTPNTAFHNLGDLHFEESSHKWGLDLEGSSYGASLADLDNDGDLDLVVNNLNASASVYRNDSSADRIAVRLKGESPNTQAIGAKVMLLGGPVPRQTQEVISGGRYESGSDPLVVFASGQAQSEMTLQVIWRTGKRSVIHNVLSNHLYVIDEESSEAFADERTAPIEPAFKDESESLRHTHHENEFDDFQRQPLLPKRLSQLGPGVTWHDLNGDGFDDLIIGSGKDGKMSIFMNDGKGNFSAMSSEATNRPTDRDETTVVAWSEQASTNLLIGLSNFEDGTTGGESASHYRYENQSLVSTPGLPAQVSSTGAIAMADFDGDGDLDLFVGGRTIPGRYPQPSSSAFFRNDGGRFVLDTANTSKLAAVGLVSGAVFSDIDGDGDPDLILAIEWGPVTVFKNENGNFVNATNELGLDKYTGWWNGVSVGDFDEDGKLDIVATNWGLNSKYQTASSPSLRVHYDDFDGNGSLDIVEEHYDPTLTKYVPERRLDSLAQGMPFLKARFPTYQQYADAGIVDLFGQRIERAPVLTASGLDHKIFFSRGGHFEAVSLPIEAQFAPAFGVNVADFDGDGHDDIFIAQNFFATTTETPRMDGGRALWIRGDGHGNLSSVPGQVTGIKIYGECRGSATADFDRDGRIDLAVTQNGAATKLFRNIRGKKGLRVHLSGSEHNPDGVGATIRLIFGGSDRYGAAREIHAGSGYWSQDSVVQVMGAPEFPSRIWIRWPGGKTTITEIPQSATEIRVYLDGKAVAVN